jgi:hypothetical protein
VASWFAVESWVVLVNAYVQRNVVDARCLDGNRTGDHVAVFEVKNGGGALKFGNVVDFGEDSVHALVLGVIVVL